MMANPSKVLMYSNSHKGTRTLRAKSREPCQSRGPCQKDYGWSSVEYGPAYPVIKQQQTYGLMVRREVNVWGPSRPGILTPGAGWVLRQAEASLQTHGLNRETLKKQSRAKGKRETRETKLSPNQPRPPGFL